VDELQLERASAGAPPMNGPDAALPLFFQGDKARIDLGRPRELPSNLQPVAAMPVRSTRSSPSLRSIRIPRLRDDSGAQESGLHDGKSPSKINDSALDVPSAAVRFTAAR